MEASPPIIRATRGSIEEIISIKPQRTSEIEGVVWEKVREPRRRRIFVGIPYDQFLKLTLKTQVLVSPILFSFLL